MSPAVRKTLIGLILAVLTVAVFFPVVRNGFVSYDDHDYVVNNPHVTGGLSRQSVLWAFTTVHASNWHPVGWLSHMLDCQLFGLNPAGHHAVNLFLHVVNVLLLFSLLSRLTGSLWKSALIAAVFAIHPLQAESVAWVAERKGVLSVFFWLLTVDAYFQHVRAGRRGIPLLSLAAYAMGLLTKPTLVTLPAVLLLLDYWPLNRVAGWAPRCWWGLLREKVPYFILAALSVLMTLSTHGATGTILSLTAITWSTRVQGALLAYGGYLRKMFWPVGLACPYPYDPHGSPWVAAGAAVVLAGISVAALVEGRRHRYLVTGWFWFLVMVFPVSTLFQPGLIGMADRYVYLPIVGILILLVFGLSDLTEAIHSSALRTRWRRVLAACAVLMILALGAGARYQVQFWKDSLTLSVRAATVTAANMTALNNWGQCLMDRGDLEEARAKFEEARAIAPDHTKPMLNLSLILAETGEPDKAIEILRRVLALKPDFMEARLNLGTFLVRTGRVEDAVAEFLEALRFAPDDLRAHVKLIWSIPQMEGSDARISAYRAAIEISPGWVAERVRLAWILANRADAGVEDRAEALRLARGACWIEGGNDPDVLRTLAAAYEAAGFHRRSLLWATRALQAARDQNDVLLPAIGKQVEQYKSRASDPSGSSGRAGQG